MARTRLQMANEVLDNLGRSGAGKTRSDTTLSTRVVTWLDRAQVQVARRYDMLFKISTASTVTSQKDYSFPSNIRALFSMVIEDGLSSRKMTPIMPWEIDFSVPLFSNHTNERPEVYIPYKSSNTFELFRIPDKAYTLRMRHSIWPTALATDTTTSDYHDSNIDLDDVLIDLSTAYGFRWLQEYVDSREWKKEALIELKRVWLAEKESFPDWVPVARGFSTSSRFPIGEYFNNPFINADPNGVY